ncbi:hypothetical protein BH10ACT11_BH10ACT11_02990 [soil metagenome]
MRGVRVFVAIFALLVLAGGTIAYAGSTHHDKPNKPDRSGTDATVVATTTSMTSRALVESRCPSGQQALSGGALATGSQAEVNTKGSEPLGNSSGKPKSWYADVGSAIGVAKTFKVFAVCSKHNDVKIETKLFPVGDDGSATVSCKGASRAVGGGAFYNTSAGNAGVLRLSSDGPLDSTGEISQTKTGDVAKSWFVAVNNPTGPAFNMTAYVICSRASKAKLVVTPFQVDGDNGVGADRVGQVAPCPRGKRALGGGVEPVASITNALISSGPLDSSLTVSGTKTGDIARAWYGSYESISEDADVKTLAICG